MRLTTYITIAFFLSTYNYINAQSITILTKTNMQPIADVMVFNQDQNQYFLSNQQGEVILEDFIPGDTIFFRHSSYKTLALPFTKIANTPIIYMQASMVNLSEVVIAANKWEQKVNEIPTKITSIDMQMVSMQNPQTAADLLGTSGEVFVQKSQMGGGSPIIRGFSTNTVLLVVDGVRLNNAIYRSGNLQNVINLDPNIMDEVEILFGPGTVIYGSDALGGVMDFHTKKAILSPDKKTRVSGNGLIRYSSANKERTGHFDFSISGKHVASVSSISYSVFDDLLMGKHGNNNDQYLSKYYVERINNMDSVFVNENPNLQKHSAYKQLNLMQKFKFRINKQQSLDYGFHYSTTSDIPRFDALRQISDDAPKYATWHYGPQTWMMHNLEYANQKASKLYSQFKVNGAYQNYKESRHTRKLNSIELVEQFEDVQIASVNVDFNKALKNKSSIYYGGEFIYNGLNSVAQTEYIDFGTMSTLWTVPRYPDGTNNYFSLAAYLGSNYKINPKVNLTAGIRYSYIVLNSSFVNSYYQQFGFESEFSNKNDAINGSLGLTYNPRNDWSIKANLSSGFHAPNWDGLGKLFTPKKEVVIVPNPDLKPEFANNAELGVSKFFLDQNLSIEALAYYTFMNQPIIQSSFQVEGQDTLIFEGTPHEIQAFINGKHAHIYGCYGALNANLSDNFGLKGSVSYTKGYDDENNGLRHVTPVFGAVHLLYQTLKFDADFNIQYSGTKKAADMAPSEQDKDYMYALDENGDLYSPAWYTLNFKINYQILPQLQFNAGIENILDQRYRPYSSGIVAPGRNFIFALRANF